MRRPSAFLAIAAALAVCTTPALTPADAATIAATTDVVDGFDYNADPDLDYYGESCAGGMPTMQPEGVSRMGGATGTHATGRGGAGMAENMYGAIGFVPDPENLTEFSFATLHESGPYNDNVTDGYLVAQVLFSPNDYYYAYFARDVELSTWGWWNNQQTISFTWNRYLNGTITPSVATGTIQQRATSMGVSSYAWLGFMFGCDGREYYMDDFTLGTSTGGTTWDFEGAPSTTFLSTYASHEHSVHNEHLRHDLHTITLRTGQKHYMAGDGYGFADGDGVTPEGWFKGNAALYLKRYRQNSFRQGAVNEFTTTEHAWFWVKPTKTTQYQMRAPGSSAYDSSASQVLTIKVKRGIRARVADRTLIRGQKIVVSGEIKPKDKGIKTTLQRKVGTSWRKLAATRTGRGGKFTLRAKTASTGRWKVRVIVAAGKGNVSNKSNVKTITVKPPPPKPEPEPKPDPIVIITAPADNDDVDQPGDDLKPGNGRRPVGILLPTTSVLQVPGWAISQSTPSTQGGQAPQPVS